MHLNRIKDGRYSLIISTNKNGLLSNNQYVALATTVLQLNYWSSYIPLKSKTYNNR